MGKKVRVTLRPDEEIEVSDAEYAELQSHGLLVEDGPAPRTVKTPAPVAAPVEKEK